MSVVAYLLTTSGADRVLEQLKFESAQPCLNVTNSCIKLPPNGALRVEAILQAYANYGCHQRVVVGHWLTDTPVLLLRAVPDVSFTVNNFIHVKFMPAAGAYTWHP